MLGTDSMPVVASADSRLLSRPGWHKKNRMPRRLEFACCRSRAGGERVGGDYEEPVLSRAPSQISGPDYYHWIHVLQRFRQITAGHAQLRHTFRSSGWRRPRPWWTLSNRSVAINRYRRPQSNESSPNVAATAECSSIADALAAVDDACRRPRRSHFRRDQARLSS